VCLETGIILGCRLEPIWYTDRIDTGGPRSVRGHGELSAVSGLSQDSHMKDLTQDLEN
jgi:hypothetical protein